MLIVLGGIGCGPKPYCLGPPSAGLIQIKAIRLAFQPLPSPGPIYLIMLNTFPVRASAAF